MVDPVFFATGCGWENTSWPSPTALGYRDADGDQRLGSMASAVNFAKSNNLLGVMLEADLLVNSTHHSHRYNLLIRFFR